MTHARRGVALLEAIVAIAILATAGVAATITAASASRAVADVREADAALRAANAFMNAVALWPREDLDRRLGERVQGPWRLRILRTAPDLYAVQLSDSLSSRVHLFTTLYRRVAQSDE